MKEYYSRIADKTLNLKLRAFGAAHIVGPKWCGKTTTAEQCSKSEIKLQKIHDKEAILATAEITPEVLLEGAKPRLIDEWQDAPKIWDAVRNYCDENNGRGHFILTGSTSKKVKTSHTGTGRISKMKMYPMSLYESKESNGKVSLKEIIDGTIDLSKGCKSELTMDDLIFAACRGGWPASILFDDKEAQLLIAKDYFEQIYTTDIFSVDEKNRNPELMKAVLKSYARNISTLAKKKSLIEDISGTNSISEPTIDDYIDVLERLYIVEDLYGWCPSIRSAYAMRSGRKREFVDPSIAVAALGLSPQKLRLDLNTFGFIFETLCIRDLRVYTSILDGKIKYYRDKDGLECDAIITFDDDRYVLVEIKLGSYGIEEGAIHLNKIEELIIEKNKNNEKQTNLPSAKIILTASEYGYKREDGIYVIPIGCLKD